MVDISHKWGFLSELGGISHDCGIYLITGEYISQLMDIYHWGICLTKGYICHNWRIYLTTWEYIS